MLGDDYFFVYVHVWWWDEDGGDWREYQEELLSKLVDIQIWSSEVTILPSDVNERHKHIDNLLKKRMDDN